MEILKQRNWTKDDLIAQGFRYYDRKRQVVMARVLPPGEAPKTIRLKWDTLVAHAGYMICYDVSDGRTRAKLDDYEHWPVEPDIFAKTYRPWDTAFKPSAPEKHLYELGCRPFYKFAGLWAKKVVKPVYVQTIESVKPVEVPIGAYITIGIKGEPTSMSAEEFYMRYEPPAQASVGLIERLVSWIKGG